MNAMNVIASQANSSVQDIAAQHKQRLQELRGMVDEAVGVTFFGQMLKMAQNNPFKADYMQGGRGEQVFRGQLNMELARHVGRGVQTGLSQAIYEQLSQHVRVENTSNQRMQGINNDQR